MIDLHLSAFAPRWRFLYVVRIDAYISPFLKKLYCRSSYLLYNQNKHCGFVFHKLRLRLVGGDSNHSDLSELVISWVTLDVSFA